MTNQERIEELEREIDNRRAELALLRAAQEVWRKTDEIDASFWQDGAYVYRVGDESKATVPISLVNHIESEATKQANERIATREKQLEEAVALLYVSDYHPTMDMTSDEWWQRVIAIGRWSE